MPLHPFLFSIFPVLFLYAKNIAFFPLNVLLIPVAATLSIALLFLAFFTPFLKSKEKAGVLVSVLLLLFFSYGHLDGVVKGALLWSLAILFVVLAFIQNMKDPKKLTNVLNFVSATLVTISLFNIGSYYLKSGISFNGSKADTRTESKTQVMSASTTSLPDIYYIILDGYGRSDVLKEMYDYDNSELLDYLTEKGFYVAQKSSANYSQTAFSLASSLNFKYLGDLIGLTEIESDNRSKVNKLIKENEASTILRRAGYKFIAFSSGYFGTEIVDADVFIQTGDFNEFENALIAATPIPKIIGTLVPALEYDVVSLHRKRVLATFDELQKIADVKGPKFVFAHIISPHPPFIFGEQGEAISHRGAITGYDGSSLIGPQGLMKDEYVKLYRGQIKFITRSLMTTMDAILSNSEKPPVIVLQSDHGPGSELDWENPENTNFEERISILNIYYFPDGDYGGLYDSITPVNTFRVIFNRYLGTNYELLPDESYSSTWSHPYKLINVTDKLK